MRSRDVFKEIRAELGAGDAILGPLTGVGKRGLSPSRARGEEREGCVWLFLQACALVRIRGREERKREREREREKQRQRERERERERDR